MKCHPADKNHFSGTGLPNMLLLHDLQESGKCTGGKKKEAKSSGFFYLDEFFGLTQLSIRSLKLFRVQMLTFKSYTGYIYSS